jgi:hypothetical protein
MPLFDQECNIVSCSKLKYINHKTAQTVKKSKGKYE